METDSLRDKMISREDVTRSVRPICMKYPDLLDRVILFGSFSRGEQSDQSDIDLYIESPQTTGKALRSKEFRSFEFDLYDAFENRIAFDLILFGGKRDLVQAKRSPLYQQVQREGVLLYEKGTEAV